MKKTCTNCGIGFEITNDDLAFLERISPVFADKKFPIPPPGLCPDCRFRERLIWRPELHLHQRKSDKSGKMILSMFAPEAKCTVYEPAEWWKDDWDPMDYGRDFDFSRPFFDQFEELLQSVPIISISEGGNENSDYINSASWNKNCYLIAGANHNEDCYYGNFVNYCKDCVDCSFIDHCELCYESIDCAHCYNLRYSQNCSNCSDSFFLFGCRGCQNCFGSVNLVEKQYVWLNEQLSKEQYEKKLRDAPINHRTRIKEGEKFFEQHRLKYPHKYMIGEMNENVTGNAVLRSKNTFDSFDVSDLEDCKYCSWFHQSKNCMDCYAWGFPAEECYMCLEVGEKSNRVLFSCLTYGGLNYLYNFNCRNCSNILGCVSIHRKNYCIFNKQYTKDEYEKLAAKIITHMQKTDEWGKFFPMHICPIAYNQAICQDYFPLTKDEARKLGARWQDEKPSHTSESIIKLPEAIAETDASICDKILTSASSGKPYKIISQEYKFYQRHNIPLPELSFYERHLARLHKRNPRKLWQRQCAKCNKKIQTTYAPDRPEIIYCEECYLREVY